MIKCKLAILLADKRRKISTIARDTGISRTTLTALASNNFKGVQSETLNTLCNYLNVTVNDILVFEDDEVKELKICPFCGADEAKTDTSYYHDGTGRVSPRYSVRCGNCGCRTGDFVKEFEAANRWNRREENE